MSLSNKLTVIIPAYNEEEEINNTLEKLLDTALKYRWEIIIVNDGSNDKTSEILKGFSAGIKVIIHKVNKGYGAALKTGIKNATTEYIAMYDSDGQHNSEDLLNMANNIGEYDMLIGKRGKDSHQVFIRKPGKWVLKVVANFLAKRKIPDLNSGLRIIKREIIVDKLHLFPDSFSFSTTSTVYFMSMGYYVDYYPIKVNKRVGKSTVNQVKHGSNTIMLIIRLIMLFNPLRIFIPFSLIFLILGIIYEIFFGIILIPNGVKLIPLALLIIIISVLIFLFGLIADQISELRKTSLK